MERGSNCEIWFDDHLADILSYKLKNELNLVPRRFKEGVNIYDYHPQEFLELYKPEKVWYFFVNKVFNPEGKNKKAKDGYWKPFLRTEYAIKSNCGNGYLMTFKFYQGGNEKSGSGVMDELNLCQIYDSRVSSKHANVTQEMSKRRRELDEDSSSSDDDDSPTQSTKRILLEMSANVSKLVADMQEVKQRLGI